MAGWYRYLVIGTLAAVMAGVWATDRRVLAVKRSNNKQQRIELPAQIGTWKGESMQLRPEDAARLPRTDISVARYVREGEPIANAVELLAVSAGDLSAFHNPDLCYRGKGYSLVRKERENLQFDSQLPRLSVERLLVQRDTARMQVLYWYAMENGALLQTQHAYPTRLGMVLNALRVGTAQRTVFYRMTTLAVDGEEQALQRNTDFLRALLQSRIQDAAAGA